MTADVSLAAAVGDYLRATLLGLALGDERLSEPLAAASEPEAADGLHVQLHGQRATLQPLSERPPQAMTKPDRR